MKKSRTFEEMIEDAKVAIAESSPESTVCIGCDSKRFKKNGMWQATYCTVIILHIDSCHGGRIFGYSESIPDYGNIRQRMMTEVSYAVRAAHEIFEFLGGRHREIHLDINPDPNHKSSVAVKEAIGYVRGVFGIEPKIKPHSWAATHAADHIVRH